MKIITVLHPWYGLVTFPSKPFTAKDLPQKERAPFTDERKQKIRESLREAFKNGTRTPSRTFGKSGPRRQKTVGKKLVSTFPKITKETRTIQVRPILFVGMNTAPSYNS
jgi:hypothetical protein